MKIEPNKIYCGDCYELIKEVKDKSVDLIITDPPYEFGTGGVGTGIFKYRESLKDTYSEIRDNDLGKGIDLKILDDFVRVMKKINIYIWCNKEQIYDYLTYFVKERGCNWEMIIWAKDNPPPFLNGHYLKDKEYCLFFWEKGVKVKPTYETGKTVYLTNINTQDKAKFNHPTIKEISIIENLIKNSTGGGSNKEIIVFDPFLGSGTVALAAKHCGCSYIGFEINEKYFKIATDRLQGINQKGELNLFDIDYEN